MNRYGTILLLAACFFAGVCSADERPAGKRSKNGADQASVFDTLVIERTNPAAAGYSGGLEPAFHYTEGIRYARIYGMGEQALEEFDRAIALDPSHSPSYYEAANSLAGDDPVKALEYSRKANALDTANVWYKSQLGRLLIITKEYEEALRVYEKIVEQAPRNPENYGMLAALYQELGQPMSAITVLDKAEEVIGRYEMLSGQKVELLMRMKLYDRAAEEGRALVNDYPYNYESFLAMAEIYAQTGKDSLATDNYNMALALNPGSSEVLLSMNEYYRRTAQITKYFETVQQLMSSDDFPLDRKIDYFRSQQTVRQYYNENYPQIADMGLALFMQYPDNYEVVDLYAWTLYYGRAPESALNLLKNHISKDTEHIEPFNDIILMEGFLERPDSVDKYSRLALQYFPHDPELHIGRAEVLKHMNKDKEALKAYRNAIKYAESDSARSVTYGIIGDFYQHKGQYKKSWANYEKALKYWPDNTVVLNNYAYYLSEEDMHLEKALVMSEKVVNELEPGNFTYIDTYGWILYKLGRYGEAKKEIQRAIALDTKNNPELFLHYGDILYALGDNYMASVYWKRALEAGHDEKEIETRLKMVK